MDRIWGLTLRRDGWPPSSKIDFHMNELETVSDLRARCAQALELGTLLVEVWKLKYPVPISDKEQQKSISAMNPAALDTIASVMELEDVLSAHFPEPSRTNIVFVVGPAMGPAPERKRKTFEEENSDYFKRIRTMLSPSDFGKEHHQTEKDPLLLNHRPAEAEGFPTELLHEVFGHFRDNCSSIEPQTQDVQLTVELSATMSRYYSSEAARLDAFQTSFTTHYGIHFHGVNFQHGITDASAIQGQFLTANVEAKNRTGSGGDPSLQNAAYYSKRLLSTPAVKDSRLPMLLLDIAGPNLSISAAILGSKVTIDPLVTINLASARHDLPKFVPILAALRVAIAELEKYYSQDPLPTVDHGQLRYPYFNTIPGTGMKLAYTEQLTSLPNRLVFKAATYSDREESHSDPFVIVKFCRDYGTDAHRACAAAGTAPRLIHTETLPGGWTVVVMEWIKLPFKLLTELSDKERDDLRPALTKAVGAMHEAGFVHGDLRRANILGDPGTKSVRIVDWDRARSEGSARYPLMAIPRPAVGVRALQPILKAHDLASLNILLAPGNECLY